MWLHLPSTCFPSAPASADSSSDCNSLIIIGERLSGASATWRGKQEPPPAWSRRWKRGGFIRLLSGLTLEPSTAQLGADAWISSLLATRVRETASQESGSENSTTDGYSTAQSTSSTPAGLILSSARTCRGTPTDSLPSQSRLWSDWAAALRSEYSARPKPETPCGGSDCSSWPTATALNRPRSPETMAKCAEFRKRNANQDTVPLYLEEVAIMATDRMWPRPQAGAAATDKNNAAGNSDFSRQAMSLADALLAAVKDDMDHTSPADYPPDAETATVPASEWRAPQTGDATRGAKSQRAARYGYRDQAGMHSLVSQTANWAGPAAQNHKGSSEGSITRADGKSRADILSYQAEQFFHPPSSPDHPTIAGGSMSSTDSPNSNQPSVKRKLNPIFVEALMRWPTGLSGFERQETAWTRWWQLMPSYLSTLVSPAVEAEHQLELL